MKTYTIEITETLQRQIEVKADSEDSALALVQLQYSDCDIVLDSDDFIDVKIESTKREA